jgi:hypothetical protein
MPREILFHAFVSHSFKDKHHLVSLVEFRRAVTRALNEVETALTLESGESVVIGAYFQDSRYGKPLPTEIRQRIDACDVFIVDLAGATPNAFYELGYAHASGRDLIVLEAPTTSRSIKADIADLLVGRYDSLDGLTQMVRTRAKDILSPRLHGPLRFEVDAGPRCFWFAQEIQEIHVICAPEPERTRFACVDDPDYLYVDNLDDRDALFELSMFLSRAYPHARILRHCSNSHSADVLECNVVVLGGPRNNPHTLDFARQLGARFRYPEGENAIVFSGASEPRTLRSRSDASGRLAVDVGYFGLFANPFNPHNRVVMCHGSHTFGTLAATLLFGDSNRARQNMALLPGQLRRRPSRIECAFEVEIPASRRIVVPVLEPGLVYVE